MVFPNYCKFSEKQLLTRTIIGLLLGIILLLILSACTAQNIRSIPSYTSISVRATITETSTEEPSPTASPSNNPTPTVTPKPSPTSTATPTPHPMSILAARQRAYPGSQITIEETLPPGGNYYRYYAWYESDGLKIYGLLTVPFGEMPPNGWPAIVFNHGYIAPLAYRTTQRYLAYVDRLASAGYIVYKIDYRGHDKSAGKAMGAYGDPGYTTDVLNAIAALKTFPKTDPQRIGIWGHSMGGFLTLRAMVISKDIIAGVIWSGVVGSYADMICCWHTPVPGRPTSTPDPEHHSEWRSEWQKLYGSPADNPEFWAGISANTFVKELSGPLQLHVGTGDTDVPIKFSQDLYQQVLAAGLPVEFYEYPGDNHDLANYFNLAMNRTIEFFDRYLKAGSSK